MKRPRKRNRNEKKTREKETENDRVHSPFWEETQVNYRPSRKSHLLKLLSFSKSTTLWPSFKHIDLCTPFQM